MGPTANTVNTNEFFFKKRVFASTRRSMMKETFPRGDNLNQ